MAILDQNKDYTLRIEWMGKRHGGYWLELIERESGNVKIMTTKSRGFFNGATIDCALRWMKDLDFAPMYKKNAM